MGGHNYNFPETTEQIRNTESSQFHEEEPEESEDMPIASGGGNKKRQKEKERTAGKKYTKTSHVSKKITLTKGTKNKGNQELFGVQGNFTFLKILCL